MEYEKMEAGLLREKRKKNARGRKKRRAGWLCVIALALLAGAVWAFLWGPLRPGAGKPDAPAADYAEEPLPGETARLTLIDVGQGLGLLAESGGEAMLIDGGGGKASSKTVALLKARGVTRLKYLVITHYDEDHMGGAVGALAAIGADTVLGPDYEDDSRTYRSLLQRVQNAGLTVLHPEPGAEFPLGALRITVLGPLTGPHPIENDDSLVLRLTDGTNSLLVTGDAETAAEAELAARWSSALQSDIYVIGHHGSYTSSTDVLLTAVRPRHLLLSCGADNEYGHPHAAAMDRLKKTGADLRRTDRQGDIRLIFTESGIVWEKPPAE
ncbi:MAG: MBL fold metallo-hydrolase [Lachnospiraceae bacterium]|nr:MBL fold metallo-hydrolase [Lachnospiraceae bacterium]